MKRTGREAFVSILGSSSVVRQSPTSSPAQPSPATPPSHAHSHRLRRELRGAAITFSSCIVNSLPCSLALFIMKSRASLCSSDMARCSFSCMALSMNSCSMSRALMPCGRQTRVRRALGTSPSLERLGTPTVVIFNSRICNSKAELAHCQAPGPCSRQQVVRTAEDSLASCCESV